MRRQLCGAHSCGSYTSQRRVQFLRTLPDASRSRKQHQNKRTRTKKERKQSRNMPRHCPIPQVSRLALSHRPLSTEQCDKSKGGPARGGTRQRRAASSRQRRIGGCDKRWQQRVRPRPRASQSVPRGRLRTALVHPPRHNVVLLGCVVLAFETKREHRLDLGAAERRRQHKQTNTQKLPRLSLVSV